MVPFLEVKLDDRKDPSFVDVIEDGGAHVNEGKSGMMSMLEQNIKELSDKKQGEHIKSDLSMDRLSQGLQKDELAMEKHSCKGCLGLAEAKHADVEDSVTALRNSIRTIGRIAYIARSPQTAAPVG
ncbi:hypothetical protein BSKO_08657 [Bryopsis sp. KO-2023]|nr:hypothetical protein BSKO_08657 [Bryopsis sp. KO-2023]